MMPPPAMTTSALSMAFGHRLHRPGRFDHPPHLEDQLERGEGRDVPVVERRRNLDDVEPDYARALGRGAQQVECLPGGEATCGWDLGPRREGGVEHVDVERDVNLFACQTVRDLASRPSEVGRASCRERV